MAIPRILPQASGRGISVDPAPSVRCRGVGSLSSGYTLGMKTAVSVPDALFEIAERHARQTKKSRSQLYAEALAEYLARHVPDEVTEAMNEVMDRLSEPTDPFVRAAGQSVLGRSEW